MVEAQLPANLEGQLSEALRSQLGGSPRIAIFGSRPFPAESVPSSHRELRQLDELALATASGLESLATFAPHLVLFQSGVDRPRLRHFLNAVSRAAPEAEMVFWAANASASSALLASITEEASPGVTCSDREIRESLAEIGWGIRSRRSLSGSARTTKLALPTESALRQFFRQLNARADQDIVIFRVGRIEKGASGHLFSLDGLLSVILWPEKDGPLLDECLFSLTCQDYEPFEIVIAGRTEGVSELVDQYRTIRSFEHASIESSGKRSADLNAAVLSAQGRYLAFVSSAQVVYPSHFSRTIERLKETDAAWVSSPVRRAYLKRIGDDCYYVRTKDEFARRPSFELRHFLRDRPAVCSFVIDRSRIGAFPLVFESDEGSMQNDILFAKLAGIFRPQLLDGAPSCEERGTLDFDSSPATPPTLQALVNAEELIGTARGSERIVRVAKYAQRGFRSHAPRFYFQVKSVAQRCFRALTGKSLRDTLDGR